MAPAQPLQSERGAAALGVEIHQQTPVTGMIIENGTIKGVETPRGRVYANKVMQAVAGSTSVVAKMAGFRLPIRTIPLQACVSVPLKPFLDQIVVSGSLHVYISQSARGELVMGGSTDPYGVYSTRSTLDFKEVIRIVLFAPMLLDPLGLFGSARSGDQQRQFGQIERFRQILQSPEFERLDRPGDPALRGHYDDPCALRESALLERGRPMAVRREQNVDLPGGKSLAQVELGYTIE